MPDPITPDLVYELVSVSGPSLAPDGGRVAFSRSEYDRERKAHRSRIMVAGLPGGEPRAFTQGDRDGSPRFSPDGESIAFQRPDDRGRKQLWSISASGGEARRITSAEAERQRVRLVAGRIEDRLRLRRRPRPPPGLRRSRPGRG